MIVRQSKNWLSPSAMGLLGNLLLVTAVLNVVLGGPALAHDFVQADFDLAGCVSVAGEDSNGVPGSHAGNYNRGVEYCPMGRAVSDLGLAVGSRVVIKWLGSATDASGECTAMQLAAGTSFHNGPHRVGSAGVVHCYGTVSARRGQEQMTGLVMRPLEGIRLEKDRGVILDSIEHGSLVIAPLFALSNLHSSDLGCGDCEWAWEADGDGVKGRLFDTGGPATQLGATDAEKRTRKSCGQYKAVYEFLANLLGDLRLNEQAPELLREADRLYDILRAFEDGGLSRSQGIRRVSYLQEVPWSTGPSECSEFCVENQSRFRAWFMGELIGQESGAAAAGPLELDDCFFNDRDERCSALSKVVSLFLEQVGCRGWLDTNLARGTSRLLSEAVFQKGQEIRRIRERERLQERIKRKGKRRSRSGR